MVIQIKHPPIGAGCTLMNSAGTYLVAALFSSTAPMTWTTNDAITILMEGILA